LTGDTNHTQEFSYLKENPVKISYLIMIWAVKILALNKKDGKGNDLLFFTKKSLPTKTPPAIPLIGDFQKLKVHLS
jgi:hypothetical protein